MNAALPAGPAEAGSTRLVARWAGPVRTAALAIAVSVAWFAMPSASLAANCNTPSHQASLSNGRVTPGSGTTSTNFVFSVAYTDNAGCVPTVMG